MNNNFIYLIITMIATTIGFFGGMLAMQHQKGDGVIHVTKGSGDDSDKYLFEFNIPPEQIPEMKYVKFDVIVEPKQQSQKIHPL